MNGISKEAEISIAASSIFPGFRFSPSDEELILYYLKRKLDGFDKCLEIIPQLDICKFEPWDLPAKAMIKSDKEWFFFSPRGKKYPNGSQSKRATEIGYWKATGKERAVKSGSNVIGTKRTLVFHIGRAPKGERTEWIIHEYCAVVKGQDTLVVCRLRKKADYHVGARNGDTHHSKPSSLIQGNATFSNSGLDLITTSGVDKMEECVDGFSKKFSSSNDSNSVSYSYRKFEEDPILLDSTSVHQHDDDEDPFADIMNDIIVQLDECPSYVTSTVDQTTKQPVVPRGHPSQGTANRRIRLPKTSRLRTTKSEFVQSMGKNSPRFNTKVSLGKKRRVGSRWVFGCMCLVMIVVIMVVLMLYIRASCRGYMC